jgi:hypothetical protein
MHVIEDPEAAMQDTETCQAIIRLEALRMQTP